MRYLNNFYRLVVILLPISVGFFHTPVFAKDKAVKKLPIEYPIDTKYGHVIQDQQFKSKVTKVNYPYHIYLPEGYTKNENTYYPIVYATDAQWVFNRFVRDIEKIKLDIILVGIEEGPRRSNRRQIDYTFPGVSNYLNFFIQEFIPHIETTFRIDQASRTLQGASFGGQLAITAMLADKFPNPVFHNILAYDSSVHYQLGALKKLIKSRKGVNPALPVKLILTRAKKGNAKANKKFAEQLRRSKFEKFSFIEKAYNVDHFAISSASFLDSLHILFRRSEQ